MVVRGAVVVAREVVVVGIVVTATVVLGLAYVGLTVVGLAVVVVTWLIWEVVGEGLTKLSWLEVVITALSLVELEDSYALGLW